MIHKIQLKQLPGVHAAKVLKTFVEVRAMVKCAAVVQAWSSFAGSSPVYRGAPNRYGMCIGCGMQGQTFPSLPPDAIQRSWQRCRAAGLLVGKRLAEADSAEIQGLPSRLDAPLSRLSLPVLESLGRLLAGTATLVVLADATGSVLACLGDDAARRMGTGLGLVVGSRWSEGVAGTNAIGTCLSEGVSVEILGPSHFLAQNQSFYCVAAPILGIDDRIVGVLAIGAAHRLDLACGRALVEMHRSLIEDRLVDAVPKNAWTISLQSSRDLFGSPLDGLAVFSATGRLMARNRAAAALLPLEALPGCSWSERWGLSWSELLRRGRDFPEESIAVSGQGGNVCFARLSRPRGQGGSDAAEADPLVPQRGLSDLDSGDGSLAEAARLAGRILDRDIPLMIQGETGSGKEWFARAFHASGGRRQGPFIAVNCAAIPAGLIEAELFGYVEGAFTDAKSTGALGKIREANGGTLFLDEIGDMPLPLQAVLLRVLETRTVLPLGGVREYPVDISLVCASHQSLQDLVSRGAFRADLFFRLSGMTVTLPALRERSDFDAIVRRMLVDEAGSSRIRIDPEALRALRAYAWPGNLRQLRNVLRLSIALLDGEETLGLTHVPTEIRGSRVRATSADLRAVQARLVRETVARHRGNISAAARELGITRTTLYRKLGVSQGSGEDRGTEGA